MPVRIIRNPNPTQGTPQGDFILQQYAQMKTPDNQMVDVIKSEQVMDMTSLVYNLTVAQNNYLEKKQILADATAIQAQIIADAQAAAQAALQAAQALANQIAAEQAAQQADPGAGV